MARPRVPSDAQAALLGSIDDHRRDGDDVFAGDEHGNTMISLYVERLGSQVPRHSSPMSVGLGSYEDTDVLLRYAALQSVRRATLQACITHGWLNADHEREITTACIGVAWKGHGNHLWTVTLPAIAITDDGRIALGLWRQRKLEAPPVAAPVLDGADRAVVAASLEAVALGCRLVPVSDEARKQARRLKREGWIGRGMVGASATCILPTPIAIVEVAPESADAPLEMPPRW